MKLSRKQLRKLIAEALNEVRIKPGDRVFLPKDMKSQEDREGFTQSSIRKKAFEREMADRGDASRALTKYKGDKRKFVMDPLEVYTASQEDREYDRQSIMGVFGNVAHYLTGDQLDKLKDIHDSEIRIKMGYPMGGPYAVFATPPYTEALSDEDMEYMRHQIVKKQPPFGGPDLSPDVQGDIDDDLIEAYFFIMKGIIELSAKTYVKEFEIQDMGLGDLDDSGYELHDDFARLEKEGKLVVEIERIKLTDKLM